MRGQLDLRVGVVDKDGIVIRGLPMAQLDVDEARELIAKLHAAIDVIEVPRGLGPHAGDGLNGLPAEAAAEALRSRGWSVVRG